VLLCAVSKARNFFNYWLPVLLWMVLIFSASSDRFSFQHSSRVIAPIVRWLIPHISEEALHSIVVVSRKAAHVTEYAILAWLVWRLVRRPALTPNEPWRYSDAVRTLLMVILYAASDEFHQRFVPSREASVRDVMIDTCGAVLALLLIWVLGRWRKRW
jgi:VanZ family protein